MNKSKAIISLISFIIITFIIYYIYSSSEKQRLVNENETKESKEIEIIDSKVNKILLAHNAIKDWYKFIENKRLYSIFTIDIEDKLIRNGDHPLLIYCSLDDITYNQNNYVAHFRTSIIFGKLKGEAIIFNEFIFLLECTPLQVELLKKSYDPYVLGFMDKYAIIAKIDSLEKINKKYDDNESTIVKAKGKCIDLIFVGKHYDSLLWF